MRMQGSPYPVYRPLRRRSRIQIVGCGCASLAAICLIFAGLTALILRPALPQIALSLAGAAPSGQTDDLFQAVTPPPTVQVQNVILPPTAVVVDLGSYGGQQAINLSEANAAVTVGSSAAGAPLATVTFTEDGLLQLCRQRSEWCREGSSQYRNVRFDLRPGGAIVYADVNVPVAAGVEVWQTAGLILRLDDSLRRFQVAGIDISGTRYSTLPSGFESVSGLMSEVERTGNDILDQLTVEAGGGRYTLDQVQIGDTTLTLVLRG